MGRIAGVTAAETRERLLEAAADVFAARGYEGTRVCDIAKAAGVSNGALYAHFDSKADLLASALRAHGARRLGELLATDADERTVPDLLVQMGRLLPRPRDARGTLVVEALVASRRDADVARLMQAHVHERAEWLTELVRAAQRAAELDDAVSPEAVAHLCLLLAFGSALLPPELHPVDREEWTVLLHRLVSAVAPQQHDPAPGART